MNALPTSQNAPLEEFLARRRRRQIEPFVRGKAVLDFGCGVNAWNSVAIQPICKRVEGVDRSLPAATMTHGIRLFQNLNEIKNSIYDVILALAVFEHIRPLQLRDILRQLIDLTHPASLLVGTVPSPGSRKLLEFLSFRMGLIDRTQIQDHKVYYDDLWLREMVDGTGWQLTCYKPIQFGLNGFFKLQRHASISP
ncbi:MAG: class I SAM-dependent methyltransferase [Kiritimatiellia bacterium]